MRAKGLREFLLDDEDLKKKITYEEYMDKKTVPGNSDYSVEKAYEEYCAVIKRAE